MNPIFPFQMTEGHYSKSQWELSNLTFATAHISNKNVWYTLCTTVFMIKTALRHSFWLRRTISTDDCRGLRRKWSELGANYILFQIHMWDSNVAFRDKKWWQCYFYYFGGFTLHYVHRCKCAWAQTMQLKESIDFIQSLHHFAALWAHIT